MSLIETNWNLIFAKHNILNSIKNNGSYNITATEINKFREARLMTKFDHEVNLPKIFKDNKLSILPLTRGSYMLGNFETYQPITYDTNIQNIAFSLPSHIDSIDSSNLYSESSALSCAYVSGIIDDVIGEDVLPTVNGRMSTGKFDFGINNIANGNSYPISVSNSQCEIDGGYESMNKFAVIEAKNFVSDDFLIRQLYYPYRLWKNKISKEVVPIFMTYSNDTFSFFTYKFINTLEYNSLQLVSQKNYVIAPEQIVLDDIYAVLESVAIVTEPIVPFPQANSFIRVIDLLGLLMENGGLTKEYITLNYAFDERQTDYYTNAGVYLGLIVKQRVGFIITYFMSDLGKQIMAKRHKQKNLSIVKCMLEHEVFNKVLREYFDTVSPVPRNRIAGIMNTCYLYNVNEKGTVARRSGTVNKWIDWILNLQS